MNDNNATIETNKRMTTAIEYDGQTLKWMRLNKPTFRCGLCIITSFTTDITRSTLLYVPHVHAKHLTRMQFLMNIITSFQAEWIIYYIMGSLCLMISGGFVWHVICATSTRCQNAALA